MRSVPRKPKHKKVPGLVGRNLRRIRDQRGVSGYKLSELSGVHRVTITALETGTTLNPDMETLVSLASALGVDPSDLLAELKTTDPAPLVSEYLATYRTADNPTDDEIEWLNALPPVLWRGHEPTVQSIHFALMARRSAKVGKFTHSKR